MPLYCFLKTLSYSRMIEQDQDRRWTDAKAPHVPNVEHFPAEAITIEFFVFSHNISIQRAASVPSTAS